MASIHLENVEKAYGSFIGVQDMTLAIADEEFLVLLGPSGCGKTTTMRMIAGLEQPTRGEIVIGGEAVSGVDARDRDVAMVFQGYALYPNMSVYENIRFPLRMRGVPKEKQDGLIRRAAEMVELGHLLDRKPGALSGGQRQRAALARAVVREPQVFLMDEPLSNLDAKLRASMRVQIKHLQRKLRITTVYVTHDQIEAMTLADRIVIMDKGAIQQVGTPDEIYSNPANTFVAGFIGSPPMNLIPGEIAGGRFRGPNVDVDAPPEVAGKVTLGIRPEDCRVAEAGDLRGEVYGVEPTGDVTYLTVSAGGHQVEVKAPRDFRIALDSSVAIAFDPTRLYFFDTASGERLRAAA
jgi:multiple sugar transport system ATP-binding protein